MAKVIRAELGLKSVRCMAEWCGHDSCIGDDHVEGLTFCQQSVGAGAYALKARKIESTKLEAATVGRSVLSHLGGCSFSLGQIACRANNLRAVGRKGSRRLDSEASRNACHENPFPFEIYSGKTICLLTLHQIRLPFPLLLAPAVRADIKVREPRLTFWYRQTDTPSRGMRRISNRRLCRGSPHLCA